MAIAWRPGMKQADLFRSFWSHRENTLVVVMLYLCRRMIADGCMSTPIVESPTGSAAPSLAPQRRAVQPVALSK